MNDVCLYEIDQGVVRTRGNNETKIALTVCCCDMRNENCFPIAFEVSNRENRKKKSINWKLERSAGVRQKVKCHCVLGPLSHSLLWIMWSRHLWIKCNAGCCRNTQLHYFPVITVIIVIGLLSLRTSRFATNGIRDRCTLYAVSVDFDHFPALHSISIDIVAQFEFRFSYLLDFCDFAGLSRRVATKRTYMWNSLSDFKIKFKRRKNKTKQVTNVQWIPIWFLKYSEIR